ncbi:transcriptional regulator [Actinoplanes cyaneus]|uniref:Transcriptional regulator n=1 Tax=Actinoplanes cyaneus TaxID=52696 RepID=A0A919IIV4_9ACTN|nr:GAF and ANTAR domain-containing protein [Actinoplanes cyaneus]MCW2136595.1 GAF domain-containing protein [Actinoplanes cyaneus]GID64258.1 transcriptional regulator [Actinoplanes cyaneus]
MTVQGGFSRGPALVDRIGRAFVDLSDTMADDFELTTYLRGLIGHCQELLGADEVSVMLADQGGPPRIAAASSAQVRRFGLAELEGGDGPSLVAYRTGETVADVGLAPAGTRWAALAAPAQAAGFGCMHAFPLRRADQVIGAMSLFSRKGRPLSDGGRLLGRALADLVAISMLQHRALAAQRLRAAQLQQAFLTRVAIEQAKGMLAERYDIPLDAAFEQMRAQARKTNRRLADLAREIIGGGELTPSDGLVDRPAD